MKNCMYRDFSLLRFLAMIPLNILYTVPLKAKNTSLPTTPRNKKIIKKSIFLEAALSFGSL